MKLIKVSLFAIAGLLSTNAIAMEYVMSCDEIVTKLDRETGSGNPWRAGQAIGVRC